MKKILVAGVALLLAGNIAASYADDAAPIKEGQWSVTVVTTSRGLPMTIPSQTFTTKSCVTNKNPLPNAKTPPGCKPPQITRTGNTITYQTNCSKPSFTMATHGHISYSGDTMEGSSESTTTSSSMTITTTTLTTGKYLGPCQ